MSGITEQVLPSIDALMQEFYIITNNLANVSTVGYKRRCNAFSRSLEAQGSDWETYTPGIIELDSAFDFSQGSIAQTGRGLDLALYGKGFFVIETPEGPLYTRNGMFHTSQTGQIVDAEGRTVAGEAGPIMIPAGVGLSQLNVAGDGSISAGGAAIGRFSIVDFGADEDKLVPAGANCYRMSDENIVPVAAQQIAVKQGYLESSNVKMVDELVDMIVVTRLYEANMALVSAQQETASSIMSVAMG
jgi:flagellar basal-body rod protein FlgF